MQDIEKRGMTQIVETSLRGRWVPWFMFLLQLLQLLLGVIQIRFSKKILLQNNEQIFNTRKHAWLLINFGVQKLIWHPML